MADTFTSLLRVVLQETGGNENTWGSVNNTSAVQLLEEAIAGRVDISVTAADVVLTTANGAFDQARNAILSITGNPGVARNVTVPSTNKTYIVSNETSPGFDVTIKTSAGAGVTVQSGQIVLLYVDSTLDNVFPIDSSAAATETQAGIAEIATQAETTTGLNDTRIITPLKLATRAASLTLSGLIELATQAEVDAGTDAVRAVTPATLAAKPIVQNIQNGNYTLVLTDATKHIYKASGVGNTITIPANASVAFPIGTAIPIVNQSGNTVSIAITTDTLTQEGTGLTGTRTLADDGMATLLKVTATSWMISGGSALT